MSNSQGDDSNKKWEIVVIHPLTEEKINFGCEVETRIDITQPTPKIEHYVINVDRISLAYQLGLRAGHFIRRVNCVEADSMNSIVFSAFIAQMFKRLGECTLQMMTYAYSEDCIPGISEVTDRNICATIEITNNGFIVKDVIEIPVETYGKAVTDLQKYETESGTVNNLKKDYYIKVFKDKSDIWEVGSRMWEVPSYDFTSPMNTKLHVVSDKYLHAEGDTVQFNELQNLNSQFRFLRRGYVGLDDGRSQAELTNRQVTIVSLQTNGQDVNTYLTARSPNQVALMALQSIPESSSVLKDTDPRLFYLVCQGAHFVFRSMAFHHKTVVLAYSAADGPHMKKVDSTHGQYPEECHFQLVPVKDNENS